MRREENMLLGVISTSRCCQRNLTLLQKQKQTPAQYAAGPPTSNQAPRTRELVVSRLLGKILDGGPGYIIFSWKPFLHINRGSKKVIFCVEYILSKRWRMRMVGMIIGKISWLHWVRPPLRWWLFGQKRGRSWNSDINSAYLRAALTNQWL